MPNGERQARQVRRALEGQRARERGQPPARLATRLEERPDRRVGGALAAGGLLPRPARQPPPRGEHVAAPRRAPPALEPRRGGERVDLALEPLQRQPLADPEEGPRDVLDL